jgi:hypothetical protein
MYRLEHKAVLARPLRLKYVPKNGSQIKKKNLKAQSLKRCAENCRRCLRLPFTFRHRHHHIAPNKKATMQKFKSSSSSIVVPFAFKYV